MRDLMVKKIMRDTGCLNCEDKVSLVVWNKQQVYNSLSCVKCFSGAYGSTLRYKNMNKILRVNDKVIIAASGEISDLDFIGRLLHDFTMEDYCHDDDIELGPKEVYSLLCRILYNRRTK